MNPSTKSVVDAQAPNAIRWFRVRVRVRVRVRSRKVDCVLAVRGFEPKAHPPNTKPNQPIKNDQNRRKVVLCVFSVFEGLWCVFCFNLFLRKCIWPRVAESFNDRNNLSILFSSLFLSLLPFPYHTCTSEPTAPIHEPPR